VRAAVLFGVLNVRLKISKAIENMPNRGPKSLEIQESVHREQRMCDSLTISA
jgi:hypothetical protein